MRLTQERDTQGSAWLGELGRCAHWIWAFRGLSVHDLESVRPRFKSQLCYLVDKLFSSLNVHLPVCNMETAVPTQLKEK